MNVFLHSTLIAVVLAGIVVGASFAGKADSAVISIVASGETHAMLKPCDCPNDPGGGLAERATVLKKFGDPEALLLLDAGGFSGGGIYDAYTEGRAADSLRTLAALRAMGAMKYDAVAIGDDDLQYGGRWLAAAAAERGVPLVSANCFLPGSKPLVPRYRIIVKKGVRFAVTAITTQERLFPLDDTTIVTPPFSGLRKLWKEMVAKSDFRIILSHCGEELTETIADTFPECDLIVNGHRKTSQAPARQLGKTLCMQFGYEGKKLSVATIQISAANRSVHINSSAWIAVARGIEPDSSLAAAIAASYTLQTGSASYDLYIMGQCPYGITAMREFVGFVTKFPEAEWNIRFIGSVTGDSLTSLRGAEEIRDEMLWLGVKELYPGAWLSFLMERGAEGATTKSALSRMRLDTAKLDTWIHEKGKQALSDHYRRSMRLAISASPTLLINNTPFRKAIETKRLAKLHCARSGKKNAFCDSLPECFEDADCRKKGAVGRCDAPGRCAFLPDAPFTFSVLIADSAIQHPETSVIGTTEELFPNVTVDVVHISSKKGPAMLKRFAPAGLPFYHFDARAVAARNYSRVEKGLLPVADGFTFKDGVTPRNYFPGRRAVRGSVVVFVDPLFAGAAQTIRALTADSALVGRLRIAPVIFGDPGSAVPGIEEKIRREEALRWLVLDSLYSRSLLAYLSAFARDPGGSYWFVTLGKLSIVQDTFVRQIRELGPLLTAHWRLLGDLGIGDPVTILLDNRQTVTVRNETDLAMMLAAIKQKGGR